MAEAKTNIKTRPILGEEPMPYHSKPKTTKKKTAKKKKKKSTKKKGY